jgi:hypothetical protein
VIFIVSWTQICLVILNNVEVTGFRILTSNYLNLLLRLKSWRGAVEGDQVVLLTDVVHQTLLPVHVVFHYHFRLVVE